MDSPAAALPQIAGYPLGETILYLRAIVSRFDRDIACAIEGDDGRHLGWIGPAADVPALRLSASDQKFAMLDPGGASKAFIVRAGGRNDQRLTLIDNEGRLLGQLRQVSTYWRQLLRTSRITMQIESREHELAKADVSIDPHRRDARVAEPIRDGTGGVLATVERQWRPTSSMTDHFDYRLNCLRRSSDPLPTLLLVTAFAHYLYDRLAVGGAVGALGKAISRPTWEV
ncbi:DUF2510 domain-containing protein [Mycobacterium sp. ITM-2016-00317]|uniref:DUF2510 domain-containing protein n=1 Tax=Mycobacterium sp. ITM-2016-00317 TaxID=2099694 RepID=UPI0037C5D709